MIIKKTTIIFLVIWLSACSDAYEGTFIGQENGGKEFKLKIDDDYVTINGFKVEHELIETQDLDDGPVYVFQLFDPDNPKETLDSLIITMQMVDSNTMKYGVSEYGLIVTGALNTMELKRQ